MNVFSCYTLQKTYKGKRFFIEIWLQLTVNSNLKNGIVPESQKKALANGFKICYIIGTKKEQPPTRG